MDRLEGAVVPPFIEEPPDGALGREALGEVTPLAAGAEDVEDSVEDIPRIGLAGAFAGIDRDVRRD